ncbi:MAG: dienelactone hydrolase family protein [Bdellovibrionales bacterium]
MKHLAWVLIALITSTDFTTALPLPPISDHDRQTRLQLLQHYPYTGEKFDIPTSGNCRETVVQLPVVNVDTHKVSTHAVPVYLPNVYEEVPAVLVVPSIMGVQITDRIVATDLCVNGMAAIIADFFDASEVQNIPGWEEDDMKIRSAIHGLRTTIDFAQRLSRVDARRIGVLGVSMGGILGSLLVGIDTRVSAAVIAAGAGNLPAIMAHTTQETVSRVRERRMSYMRTTDATIYEMELRKHQLFDPIHFAAQAHSTSIFMTLIEGDTTVPTENQMELWRAFGTPSSQTMTGSHLESLVTLIMFYRQPLIDFLRAHLLMQ